MKKLKINKQGEVVGIGAFGGKNPEFIYIRIPDDYALDELTDEIGKPLYKYGGISQENEKMIIKSNDREDTPKEARKRKETDFRKRYSTEERIRLQDEAIKALVEGKSSPKEYQDYLQAKKDLDL